MKIDTFLNSFLVKASESMYNSTYNYLYNYKLE